jgi:hypothetical protein
LRLFLNVYPSIIKMSYNWIFQKKMLDTIMKGGKEIKLSAATQTSSWKRPDVVALELREPLKKAVQNFSGELPNGTTEICVRCDRGIGSRLTQWLIE